jgi:SEC-C motif
MRVGRNESCPCGSGKKYKHCCEGTESSRGMSKGLMFLLCAIGAIAAAGLVPMIIDRTGKPAASRAATPQPAAIPQQPQPQPPGQPPPGKVWSAEHGHWHDAAAPTPAPGAPSPIRIEQSSGPAQPTGNTAPISVSRPQPPGEVPPGKVWSTEHGHWHDAAPAAGTPPKTQ